MKAASTARVWGSVRYSIGFLALAGARRALAAWLSATRVMSSPQQYVRNALTVLSRSAMVLVA